MAISADYHLHSHFSTDSDTPMETQIQKGIALGLTRMCFTEHMDMDYPISESAPAGSFVVNTDSYLYELIKYKEKYADKIQILFGIELGLQPHLTWELAKYIKSYDFDFVLASSHTCHGKDPYFPPFFAGRSEAEAYREYFESLLENIKKFTNYDVYAHLDYVVRYGPNQDAFFSYTGYRDLLDEIITVLIDQEKGLEVNTGAVRYGLKELNPCCDILKRYRELGGEIITVGSDAHTPDRVGDSFDKAAEVLTACGFRYYTTFEKRMPQFHRI